MLRIDGRNGWCNCKRAGWMPADAGMTAIEDMGMTAIDGRADGIILHE